MTGPLSDAPRWAGYTHAEIYELVRDRPGHAASQYAEGEWSALWFTIEYVDARLSKAIAEIGSGWEGQAASATAAGVTPLGVWAQEMADRVLLTRRALNTQASDAQHVKVSMPPPSHAALPETPPTPGPGITPADLTDWAVLDGQRDEQARRAVELMEQYTVRSEQNVGGFATFTPPPTVVVADASGAGAGGPRGAGVGALSGAGTGGADVAPGSAAVTPAGAVAPAGAAAAAMAPGGAPPSSGPGPAAQPGTSAFVPPAGAAGGGAAAPARPERGPASAARSTPMTAGPVPGARGPGGGAALRPAVPGRGRHDSAVPLGPYSARHGRPGTGATLPGTAGPGTPTGRDATASGSAATPRGSAGLGGRLYGDPLPPPVRPPSRSPDNPFPSVGGEPQSRSAGTRTAVGGHPGLMPMGAGAGGAREETHRRPDYLIEERDVFADDRYFTPPVIGGDDEETRRG